MTAVEKIKAKILDLAIRGKLVPQNPDDEPASVLLERIKEEKARLVKEGKIKKEKNPSEIVVGSDGRTYEKFADGSMKNISDEIPFDLPQGWTWARVSTICTGFQYGTARKSSKSGRVPVLRMGNLHNGVIDFDDLVFTSNEEDIRQYALTPGDLLFNRTNSDDKVGKVSLFKNKTPCIFAGYLVRFRPVDCDCEYINFLMNSNYQRRFCQSEKSDAVNQSNISASKFARFLVPLPPFAEQQRIVSKVNELFSFADATSRSMRGMSIVGERINKKILNLAIRGLLIPQDKKDEPASKLVKRIQSARTTTRTHSHKEPSIIFRGSDRLAYETKNGKTTCIQDETPFKIPDSWEWIRLGDVFEVLDSMRKPVTKKDRKPGPYPYYGATSIQDYVADFIFDEPLVLLGEDGAKWGKGECSSFCVDGKIWVNNHAHVLRPRAGISPKFFAAALTALDLTPYVTGTTVPKLNQEKMKQIILPLPPLAEQTRIVAKVEELQAMTWAFTT